VISNYKVANPSRVVAAFIFLYALTIAVHLNGMLRTGFLSDDYVFIEEATKNSLIDTLFDHPDEKHVSLIMPLLFKLTAEGHMGVLAWRILALIVHGANIFLLFLILRQGLSVSFVPAWFASLLFALNPAGLEALAWSCSIGYVLVAGPILLAVYLSLTTPVERLGGMKWVLGFLQLAAYVIWDWGILLCPLVFLCLLHRWLRGDLKPRRAALACWPLLICWTIGLASKFLFFSYTVGPSLKLFTEPIRVSYLLVASPMFGILPQFSWEFYKSLFGLSIAVTIFALLLAPCIRSPKVRLLLVLFFFCQLPYAMFAWPQARYFYLPMAFLYGSLAMILTLIRYRGIRWLLFASLLGFHGIWTVERSNLWKDTYEQALKVKSEIENISDVSAEELIVVNLPESYGPEGMWWRPFVWQNGFRVVSRKQRVNIPGTPYVRREEESGINGIRMMSRDEIISSFPPGHVYEVVYSKPGDWREFKVIPFRAHPDQANINFVP